MKTVEKNSMDILEQKNSIYEINSVIMDLKEFWIYQRKD